jgi:hypothetical protein
MHQYQPKEKLEILNRRVIFITLAAECDNLACDFGLTFWRVSGLCSVCPNLYGWNIGFSHKETIRTCTDSALRSCTDRRVTE